MRVVVMKPDSTFEVTHIDGKLHEFQELVGGFVEAPQTGKPDVVVWCNEDGKYQGLPINYTATQFWWDTFGLAKGTDFLVGTVVITGTKGAEADDVPPWVIHKLRGDTDG